MQYNLYVTHNILSGTCETIFPYTTDGMAKKYIAITLKQMKRDVSEYELYHVARFDEETGEITPVPKRIVRLDFKDPEREIPNSNPNVDDRKINIV